MTKDECLEFRKRDFKFEFGEDISVHEELPSHLEQT